MNDKTNAKSKATAPAQNLTYGLFGCKMAKHGEPTPPRDLSLELAGKAA